MSDFLLDLPEDFYDEEVQELDTILRRQKKMSRQEMIEEDERRRRGRIIDILLCKIKSKKVDELYALLTNSPDQSILRPQDIRLDAKKRTALHYIADMDGVSYNKDPAEWAMITEEVLASKIDPTLMDINGKTAIEYCTCPYMKKILES